jgi:gas vesicle protein
MDSGKIILGVLAGAVAGTVLGVLFAPAKGSDIRKKICKKEEIERDMLKEKFNEFLNGISEKFDKTKNNVSTFAEQAKTKLEEVGKEIKSAKE